MIEHPYKRTHNSKSFNDGGLEKVQIFSGPVHYFNKLKVGDGVDGFRSIDNTLVWDAVRRGWTFLFNNYQPFVPEFADQWFLYRDLYQGKDQIFAFRPRNVGHVAGRLAGTQVIYDDAFGLGIDLIINFTFRKMQKLIRIRAAFKPVVDTTYNFELAFPGGTGIYQKDLDSGAMTTLDPLSPQVLTPRSMIYIGTDRSDGEDWYTRIEPFRIWDSGVQGLATGKKTAFTPAAIVVVGGVCILRKKVLASFLTGTIGDVYTDATSTYYETSDTYYGTSFTTGGAPDAETMTTGGWGDQYFAWLQWDLTSTEISSRVLKAEIWLYISSQGGTDPVSFIDRVTSSWTEAGVTLASHPTFTTTGQVAMGNLATHGIGWLNKTITQFYSDWKDGVNSNFGVTLQTTATPGANMLTGVDASEITGGVTQPYLLLTLAPKSFPLFPTLRPAIFKPGNAK